MARILAVGNATLDIINVLDHYPAEDEEVRAESQHIRRGGNAANTLTVLSQFAHDCEWAGTLGEDPNASLVVADLARHNVGMSAAHTVKDGLTPTSYVTLNLSSGSRTIIHYRDLPEFSWHDFERIDLSTFDWLHFEGRNIDQIERMLEHARSSHPELTISLEVEKRRRNIEHLFRGPNVLMFSRDYAKRRGFHSAPEFLSELASYDLPGVATCTWAEHGAYGLDRDKKIYHVPAFPPHMVVETLGAGDVFNAGLINSLLNGQTLESALVSASRVAGKKCGIYGFDGLAG